MLRNKMWLSSSAAVCWLPSQCVAFSVSFCQSSVPSALLSFWLMASLMLGMQWSAIIRVCLHLFICCCIWPQRMSAWMDMRSTFLVHLINCACCVVPSESYDISRLRVKWQVDSVCFCVHYCSTCRNTRNVMLHRDVVKGVKSTFLWRPCTAGSPLPLAVAYEVFLIVCETERVVLPPYQHTGMLQMFVCSCRVIRSVLNHSPSGSFFTPVASGL